MKLKDIERKFKKESESVRVPDVYSGVKQIPINKLLNDELPLKAFNKRMVMRLLVLVLVMFTAIAICLSAMWLTDGGAPTVPDSYVSVEVVRGDTEQYRFGFVVGGDKSVGFALAERYEGNDCAQKLADILGKDLQNAIKQVYVANNADKIYVCVQSANLAVADGVAKYAALAVEEMYDSKDDFTLSILVGDADKRAKWIGYINAHIDSQGQKASAGMGVNALIDYYIAIFD